MSVLTFTVDLPLLCYQGGGRDGGKDDVQRGGGWKVCLRWGRGFPPLCCDSRPLHHHPCILLNLVFSCCTHNPFPSSALFTSSSSSALAVLPRDTLFLFILGLHLFQFHHFNTFSPFLLFSELITCTKSPGALAVYIFTGTTVHMLSTPVCCSVLRCYISHSLLSAK